LRPSEYSVLLLDRSRHRPKSSSSGISRSFRVRHPLEYRPYWFCDPALPLARCLGCAVFLARAAADDSYVIGRVLSSNLTFPLECYPATPTRPPQRPSPLMGFASLQHLRNSRSTSPRASRPATFRLQGLVTLLTVYSLRTRAGFVSHRRRSWDSPFGAFSSREGVRYVSARTRPLTVSPAAIPSAEARDRHGRPRFLGFDPSGNPWRPNVCLAHRALDAPLGFALLGF
jgi:hypothetical protein